MRRSRALSRLHTLLTITREAQRAPQAEAHHAQADQSARGHQRGRPWMREQEHRADTRLLEAEYAREEQQPHELVAADLAGRRRQDERQVEERVAVEHHW